MLFLAMTLGMIVVIPKLNELLNVSMPGSATEGQSAAKILDDGPLAFRTLNSPWFVCFGDFNTPT